MPQNATTNIQTVSVPETIDVIVLLQSQTTVIPNSF